MSEEMRKEFEEWYDREGKSKPFTTINIKDKMYYSWKASRESMKPIKLPGFDYEWTEIADAHNAAITECKEAIQQAGYKVEE